MAITASEPDDSGASWLPNLTSTEADVLARMAHADWSVDQIASAMAIPRPMVVNHIRNVMEKLSLTLKIIEDRLGE